jgi:hypothetical protein
VILMLFMSGKKCLIAIRIESAGSSPERGLFALDASPRTATLVKHRHSYFRQHQQVEQHDDPDE